MCRTPKDITAIAIETGIQNTGMSIFILWFTLDHPLGDIAGKQTRLKLPPKSRQDQYVQRSSENRT